MNVTVTHHNAALRLLDSQDQVIQTLMHVRPNIQGSEVAMLRDAIRSISQRVPMSASMTITEIIGQEA